MKLPAELDATARDLLMELHRVAADNSEAQVSMYTLGEAIGLDRDGSAKAAEDLIATGLVEIRTLSGGIGLSQAGLEAFSEDRARETQTPRLGTASPLDPPRCEQVERLLVRLKGELGQSGLDYEALAEIVADIRTVESQLASPRPKTVIVRECLASVRDVAAQSGQEKWRDLLAAFIG